MARFVIEPILRPCYVTVYKADRSAPGFIRKEETRGLFHTWLNNSSIVEPSYLKGGHSGGVVSTIVGVVEFGDGTVRLVEPSDIRFVDNEMCKYIFPDELEPTNNND